MLCSIFYKDVFVFRLSFIFSFILHPSWIIFYPYSYILFFSFFLLIHLSIRDKKGESILVCIVISIWLVNIRGGRKPLERCIHQGGEDIFFEKTLFCFAFCLFSHCFMVLWVIFSIYALLLSSHRVYVLEMHLFLYYCALLVAYSDNHLLWYMIIVVISIWLFWCMIKLLTCFTSCLLDRNLLVTLYLSFFHLVYLEGLMCFVHVFQVTSIHVPSSSQLLDLGVSEFCHCSQTHV